MTNNRATDRMRGPVVERRGQIHDGSTTDQRLLDSRGSTDWLHTDPWRVLRMQAEFVEGFGALAELGPAIAVFGSARGSPAAVGRWCCPPSPGRDARSHVP